MTSVASKAEKERRKIEQDQLQTILGQLLKDEDNKYCADCDAKGPRWASWNLGIFLCIRCAGIHRNLGVHISKVKSVNLDSWTPEQVAMMTVVGNSVARGVYEANLPEAFRRPQTDSSLEAFIRAKYDQKRYMAKDWVPPRPDTREVLENFNSTDKARNRATAKAQAPPDPVPPPPPTTNNLTSQQLQVKKSPRVNRKKVPSISDAPPSPNLNQQRAPQLSAMDDLVSLAPATTTGPMMGHTGGVTPVQSSGVGDILGFDEFTSFTGSNATQQPDLSDFGIVDGKEPEVNLIGSDKKSTSDILALYNNGTLGNTAPAANYMPTQATTGHYMSPVNPVAPPMAMYGSNASYMGGMMPQAQVPVGMPYGGAPGMAMNMPPAYGGYGMTNMPPAASTGWGMPPSAAPMQQSFTQMGQMAVPQYPGLQNQFAAMQIQGQSMHGSGNTLSNNLWQ